MQTLEGGGLFFEDDIEITDARLWDLLLGYAVASDKVVTFFVPKRPSIHPVTVLEQLRDGSVAAGLYALRNTRERRGFYGTQAMYFPAWAVNVVMMNRAAFLRADGFPLEEGHGFDFWIKENIPEVLGAFPNPVEHLNPPKMRNVSRGLFRPSSDVHTSLTNGVAWSE